MRKSPALLAVGSCLALAFVATTLGLATSASADGPYRGSTKDYGPPPFSWNGFYIGVNGGHAWGDSDVNFSNSCDVPTGIYCGGGARGGTANAIQASGNGSLDPKGFTGGIQAGRNWQTGNIVYGLEVDFNSFNLNESRSVTQFLAGPGFTYTIGSSIDTDWLLTARGRLGWATSNLMLYATGGLAVTRLEVSQSYVDDIAPPGSALQSSSSRTQAGWTLGGGFEYALSRNLTFKGEYLYMNFGAVSTTGNVVNAGAPGFIQPHTTSADLTANIVRAGLNYKF